MKRDSRRTGRTGAWLAAAILTPALLGVPDGEARSRALKRKRPKARKSVVSVSLPRQKPTLSRRLRARIRSRAYSLRSCYDRLLKKRPRREGTVRIRFTLRRNGRPKKVRVTTALPRSLKRCVRSRVQRWRLGRIRKRIAFGPLVLSFSIAKPRASPVLHRLTDLDLRDLRGGHTVSLAGCSPKMSRKQCSEYLRALRRRARRRAPPRRVTPRRAPPRLTRRFRVKGRLSAFVPPVRGVPRKLASRVRSKIRARVYGLRTCYNRVLAKKPRSKGTAKISFQIRRNGRVRAVKVIVHHLPPALRACILKKVARWHFGSVPRRLRYGPFTVRFTPPSAR